MRHLATALALIALLVAWMVDVPFVSATGAGGTEPNAKVVRAAEKAGSRVVKGTAKAIRGSSAVAAKKIKGLTKALKNGKKAEDATGLPPTADGKVSPAQLARLFDLFTDCVVEFHTSALGSLEGAYVDVAADSDWRALELPPTTTTIGAMGLGGPPDRFVSGLSDGYESGNDKFVKAVRKFQTAMRNAGFLFSYIDAVPLQLSDPGLGPDAVSPTDSATIVGTVADCTGTARALVYHPTNPSLPGSEPQVHLRSRNDGSLLGQLDPAPGGDVLVVYTRLVDNTDTDGGLERRLLINLDPGGNSVGSSAPVTLPPPAPVDDSKTSFLGLISRVTGIPIARLQTYTLAQLNEVFNSNPDLLKKLTSGSVDAACGFGFAIPFLPNKIGRLDAGDFPCGAGPNGFTVCPTIPMPDPGGDMIVIGIAYAADIPLTDPTNLYQYGFVFDQDGNTGNNYVPIPAFANDYFRDSDKWYAVEYSPANGWELKVTDARNGSFVPVASAARAVIKDNAMVLAVPASEFSVSNPAYRTTSFRHTGDFGQNPPFNWLADYDPPPGEALRSLPTE